MSKKLFMLAAILALLPSAAFSGAFAFEQISPPAVFYASTFDNLVLNFSIGSADTMKALVVRNEGTAGYPGEINKVVLWQDNANGLFDGFAKDNEIATAAYDSDNYVWVFNGFSTAIPSGGAKFFVTVETRKSGTSGKYFQFSLPAYYDANANGNYDKGDAGIFLSSSLAIPAQKWTIDKTITYKTASADNLKPITILTNLSASQTITSADFTITGKSKDQGGSYPGSVEVCIDAVCKSASSIEANYLTWEFLWANISVGSHEIYTKTKDFNNNEFISSAITVTREDANKVSASDSTVSIDKTTVTADASDKATIKVTLKNKSGAVLANKVVYLNEVRTTGTVTIKIKSTDAAGEAVFTVSSETAEEKTFSLTTNEGESVKDAFVITFSSAAVKVEDYVSANWIKLADEKAVYYLDSNKVRHAYPTQAVWESYFGKDFSSVKTVDAETMAGYELGKNVPFKAGALMKIPSVNKVYKVEASGVLRWIKTAAKAAESFGADWKKLVKDLPESFWTDYTVGAVIE